jgi:multidrug efflux pump
MSSISIDPAVFRQIENAITDLDQQLANDFFAQAVVVTKGFKVRPGVQKHILAALQRPEFEQVMSRVTP